MKNKHITILLLLSLMILGSCNNSERSSNMSDSTYSKVQDSVTNESTQQSGQGSPTTEILAILQNYRFMRANGLTSLLGIDFKEENQYTMRLVAPGSGELIKVTGTYQVTPVGESQAKILLAPTQVQKFIGYDKFQSFDIDLFIASNINYTLRKFQNSDIEKFAKENIVLAQSYKDENKLPVYLLEGSAMFYSDKKLTQSQQDSIADVEKKNAAKKANLEEKLKGL